jgi:hypothetical protein
MTKAEFFIFATASVWLAVMVVVTVGDVIRDAFIDRATVRFRPVRPKGQRDWYVDTMYMGIRLRRKRAWSASMNESSYEAAMEVINAELTRRADTGYIGTCVTARDFHPFDAEFQYYGALLVEFGFPSEGSLFPLDDIKAKLERWTKRMVSEAEVRSFVIRYFQWASIQKAERELLQKQLVDIQRKGGIFKPMEDTNA